MRLNKANTRKGARKKEKSVASLIYRKSSIRSRPCITLDSNFLRLVLEIFQKLRILQQNFFLVVKKGPQKSLKMPKKYSYNGK